MMTGRPAFWAALAMTLAEVSAQNSATECGSGATAAAIVFAILFLLSLGVLAYVLYRYVWKPRQGPALEKVILAENGHEESKFAFDNPYFEGDDDIGNKSTLPSNDILAASEKTNTVRSNDSSGAKKSTWSPFTAFSSQPKTERRRAMDDSFLAEPQQVSVPLRGHDFTGLGFNICGNMREGIFVKDVLHRGPASESGRVRAGDRITGVTVSFAHVVLEDALTILSYASPYDVQLHLEKDATQNPKKAVTSQPSTSSERLCHPFYRSQSIDDLTKIGRSKLQPVKTAARPTSSYVTSETASSKPDGSLTPKASSFNEKLLSKSTPPAAPRTETSRLVQRDHLAVTVLEPSPGGYREMAVDVPDHVLEMDAKRKAADSSQASRLGVKVLPDPSAEGWAADSEPPCTLSEERETAADQTDSVPAAGSPGRTEPGTPPADGEHKTERSKFKMGISGFGFKKQKSKADSAGDAKTESQAAVASDAAEAAGNEDERSKKGVIPSINVKLPKFGGSKPVFENEKYVKRSEEEVEIPQPLATEMEKFRSEINTAVRKQSGTGTSSASSSDVDAIEVDRSTDPDGVDKKGSKSKSWGLKGLKKGLGLGKKPESGEKDAKTSSGSSSGEDAKEALQAEEIPQEMRLAAGVAQDRRNRRTRQHSSSSSSSDDEKRHEKKTVTPQPIEVEVKVADTPLSSLLTDKPEVEEDFQKEVRQVDTALESAEEPRTEVDKIEVLKEVLSMTPNREVPPKQPAEVTEDAVSETVEKSTVHRSTVSGSSDTLPRITGEVTGLVEVGERKRRPESAGPGRSDRSSSSSSSSEDGAGQPPRARRLRKRRSDCSRGSSSAEPAAGALSSDEEKADRPRLPGLSAALPLSSTEISVDTSSTEPLNASTPVKRPAGDEHDRKCASMGDLYRLEPGAPDSPPLERAVSLELRNAEPERGLLRSSAAEAGLADLQEPRLDLSQVGRPAPWEGAGAAAERRAVQSSSGSDGRTQIEVVPEETERASPAGGLSSTVVMLNQSAEDVTVISTEASVSGQWVTAEEGDTLLAAAADRARRSSSSSSSSSDSGRMEIDEATQTSAADAGRPELGYVSVSSVTVGEETFVVAPAGGTVLPSVESKYTSSATVGGESVTYVTSADLVEMVSVEAAAGVHQSSESAGQNDENGSKRNRTSSSSSSSSSSSDDDPAGRQREPEGARDRQEGDSRPQQDTDDDVAEPTDGNSHRPLLRGDSKTRLLQTVLDAHEIKVTPVHKDRRNSGSAGSPLSVEVSSLIPPPARPRPAPAGAASPPGREVIEISEDELDAVMISHRDYLLRQAERLSQSPRAADEAGPELEPHAENGDKRRPRAAPPAGYGDGAVSTTLIIGEPRLSGAVTATVVDGGPGSPPPALQPPPE